jgi:hypothetical protein
MISGENAKCDPGILYKRADYLGRARVVPIAADGFIQSGVIGGEFGLGGGKRQTPKPD